MFNISAKENQKQQVYIYAACNVCMHHFLSFQQHFGKEKYLFQYFPRFPKFNEQRLQ